MPKRRADVRVDRGFHDVIRSRRVDDAQPTIRTPRYENTDSSLDGTQQAPSAGVIRVLAEKLDASRNPERRVGRDGKCVARTRVDGRIDQSSTTLRIRARPAARISALSVVGPKSRRADGMKLTDFADLVLDTGAPVGDAMVKVAGLDTAVSPGSTVGGAILVNAIKAEVAARLTAAGQPPTVLSAGAVVGVERATKLFEAAYDEHAHRLAKLYEKVGPV